ncbi:hypothetical protein YC2023_013048 [Brassica napus]
MPVCYYLHRYIQLKYPSSENRTGVMEMEWLKKKLEEMRALLDESEGGEVTEELRMRLEEESRNLLDKGALVDRGGLIEITISFR